MSIWALSESLQPDQPFSVQGSNCGVQSNWRECARSKAFCLSTENIAWRWLRCRWCAMCVGLWLLHLRIPVVSETELKCRNAPHRQREAPCLACLDSTLFPGTGGRGGPSRPALRSTIQSFMQRGALQGPGYLRSTPVAQVLCESVLLQPGSQSKMLDSPRPKTLQPTAIGLVKLAFSSNIFRIFFWYFIWLGVKIHVFLDKDHNGIFYNYFNIDKLVR